MRRAGPIGPVTVDVGPIGLVGVRRVVQGYLGVVEGMVERKRRHQLAGDIQSARTTKRGFGGGKPASWQQPGMLANSAGRRRISR